MIIAIFWYLAITIAIIIINTISYYNKIIEIYWNKNQFPWNPGYVIVHNLRATQKGPWRWHLWALQNDYLKETLIFFVTAPFANIYILVQLCFLSTLGHRYAPKTNYNRYMERKIPTLWSAPPWWIAGDHEWCGIHGPEGLTWFSVWSWYPCLLNQDRINTNKTNQ